VVYDLVVDRGALGLCRVQVKTATSKQDGHWQAWITRSGRVPYTRAEVDVIAVVDGDLQVYMIPIEEVKRQQGVRLRSYERHRLTTR
jgi:hypothetical protein